MKEQQTSMNQSSKDDRSDDQRKKDAELAERLSGLIEDANSKVAPLCNTIRKHIETMESKKEEDRDEQELIKQAKPPLEQGEKILNETHGAIKGADPPKSFEATPEEQRLAEALKVLIEEVGGTIDWARNKLDSFPKAKKNLGPLLDALGQPLTQIVGGVGMLLAGVLNLVGNLLKGLGLDGLFKSIVGATTYLNKGLDKIISSGLDLLGK
ncbi:hypothetical protein D9757_010557 [Collybiopsis confluens]|uniref:DUF6987 domain-containing protein n=1 Tax=Collybiopsis confluens TaxID=2823264 RepID=A0A8H5GXN6_9AGAR|nr:hypothetical protein D9757_010557 [Collybiopsis confluens]